MSDRSIVGEVFFVEIVFLEKRHDRTRFELISKGTRGERKVTIMMLVKVGRRADKHCLRRDVGMGSRSEKEFDDWEIILDTSLFRDQRERAEYDGSVFRRSMRWWNRRKLQSGIQFENFVWEEELSSNICVSDWEAAIEGTRGVRSRRVLMEIQSLRGFEEEEAIREALKRFLAAIIAEWYLFEAVWRSLRWWGFPGHFEDR